MPPQPDLIPVSALQHWAYCPRQCALIHVEGVWAENRLTVEGRHLHEAVHGQGGEARGELRVARGVAIRSLRLGLIGVADCVEFRRVARPVEGGAPPGEGGAPGRGACAPPPRPPEPIPGFLVPEGGGLPPGPLPGGGGGDAVPSPLPESGGEAGAALPGLGGLWTPFPIEYKRGKPKPDDCDRVQLCAQALCLEEMLGCAVPTGALFYGRTRRREDVAFSPGLRRATEEAARAAREMLDARRTPPPLIRSKKCRNCSLREACLPKAAAKSASRYLARMIGDTP